MKTKGAIYSSTKTYPEAFSTIFRQWRANSHCARLHGYALSLSFTFSSYTLDVRNWVIDFGGMDSLKRQLADRFDHTMVVAKDDPEFELLRSLEHAGLAKMVVLDNVGCEAVAQFLGEFVTTTWLPTVDPEGRVWVSKVSVRETASNMAAVTWELNDWM